MPSKDTPWGGDQTQYFYQVTPEKILDAVEAFGFRVTGRCLPMASMENRVYEVELEVEDSEIKTKSDRFRIVKFYRPGRWSEAQILEEHQFLDDLQENEIPVVAPENLGGKGTLHKVPDADIWCTVFPKVGGRSPDELNDSQLAQIGRLLARLHNVGESKKADHRIELTPDSYGRQNLESLLRAKSIPLDLESRYRDLVNEICDLSDSLFESVPRQRVHGDCHFGNLLWSDQGPFWVDFDDMVRGPCVQDIWLVVPGRDQESIRQRNLLLSGYEEMREFDDRTIKLIEPLRALRFIHFSAWIAKRWEDPAFPAAFPQFGTHQYWQQQVQDLEEQLQLIRI